MEAPTVRKRGVDWRIYIYIYVYISSNLHPSPNSRWLHHTALRYMRRAQSGAYMWWKGLNSVKTGSKRAKNTCLSIPNGPGSLLEKRVFDPFLTHFWSQNGPFSRHFGIFQEPKPVPTGSKWAKTTCLSIPSGLGTTLEKSIFFAPGTLVDPPLAPTVRGLAGPPAAPSDHWYGGLRVSLGDSEASKPQKVGDCGFESLLGLFWAKNGSFWPKAAQIWEGTSRLGTPAPGRHR